MGGCGGTRGPMRMTGQHIIHTYVMNRGLPWRAWAREHASSSLRMAGCEGIFLSPQAGGDAVDHRFDCRADLDIACVAVMIGRLVRARHATPSIVKAE